MMHYILKNNLHDEEYINKRTENFEAVKEIVENFTIEEAARICQVPVEDLIKAAKIYGEAESAGIYYTMGVTQHSHGTDNVKSVANLAMMCGNVGIANAGVNPLRGQNNVQGSSDAGALPFFYPGYQKVDDPKAQEKFEKLWGVDLSPKIGLTIPKIMEEVNDNKIKFIYVMGENPMVSEPDLNHFEHAIGKLDFLVVQDIFLTETAEIADVVLPATCFAEKVGTFTNSERRIQMVRKAVEPPGEAKEDWLIVHELMERLGYKNDFSSPKEIMDELATTTDKYGGVNYERVETGKIQWPCKSLDDPGTPYLHKGTFSKGIGSFHAVHYLPAAEVEDSDYPFVLTTGRILYHFHTRTMTAKEEGIQNIAPSSYLELSFEDAKNLGVQDGELLQITSRRGQIQVPARLSDKVSKGIVFIPFHFYEQSVNRLTNEALDPVTNIPELKVCSVRIDKID
jgi:formate dehydrogenase major subunit